MKNLLKKLAISASVLSMLIAPTSVFANQPNNSNHIEIGSHNINSISVYGLACGELIYDNVILNSSLGSDNVYLGQVNTGDHFEVLGFYGNWLYVIMETGNNAGRIGYIYRPYTKFH